MVVLRTTPKRRSAIAKIAYTPDARVLVFAAMPEKHHGAFADGLAKFKAENKYSASPAQRGETVVAPRLLVEVQGELLFVDNARLREFHD